LGFKVVDSVLLENFQIETGERSEPNQNQTAKSQRLVQERAQKWRVGAGNQETDNRQVPHSQAMFQTRLLDGMGKSRKGIDQNQSH